MQKVNVHETLVRGILYVSFCFALMGVLLHVEAGAQESGAVSGISNPAAGRPETTTSNTNPADNKKVNVIFDEKQPGIAFIEVNGERIKIDTARKTVEHMSLPIESATSTVSVKSDAVGAKDEPPKKKKVDLEFTRTHEPYDYRVVNIPTPKSVPKGTWNLIFTHRFSQPLNPLSESARNLIGLDSFAVPSFGLIYGITDKLYVSAYRSPLCQRGLCRVIEVGLGYNWIAQDKRSPIGLTTYASIEGNGNFTEEYTYNAQAMLSARVHKRLYLFFSPAVHINANGQRRFDPRPNDYFPPATVANDFRQPTHGASFGFGASVMITRDIVALFDFVPRTGFKLSQVRPIFDNNFRVTGFVSESHPSIGFGIQRNVGDHSFALTFSNTQSTTTSRYNSSNLAFKPQKLIIGFNMSRRF